MKANAEIAQIVSWRCATCASRFVITRLSKIAPGFPRRAPADLIECSASRKAAGHPLSGWAPDYMSRPGIGRAAVAGSSCPAVKEARASRFASSRPEIPGNSPRGPAARRALQQAGLLGYVLGSSFSAFREGASGRADFQADVPKSAPIAPGLLRPGVVQELPRSSMAGSSTKQLIRSTETAAMAITTQSRYQRYRIRHSTCHARPRQDLIDQPGMGSTDRVPVREFRA